METKCWYSGLVQWITNKGGCINESLGLEENSKLETRGIYAKSKISKGSLLIHLPASLALSGDFLPSQYEFESTSRNASNWLKCITALLSELHKKNGSQFDNYLSSLPSNYETLLHHSSWPDKDVHKYLSGTTIGICVKEDRKSFNLKTRFEKSVKPFLIANKVIDECPGDESELFAMFEIACACVATRAFHLKDDNKNATGSGSYLYLLPYIDMLNHSSSPTAKCTTLQRRTATPSSSENEYSTQDGFFMIAERDIQEGEEILHSYGNLTSGQQLQTFGFVEGCLVQRALKGCFNRNQTTPAVIPMSSIMSSCLRTSLSDLPQKLEEMIQKDTSLQDFDVWNLPQPSDLESRKEEVQALIPNDLIINFDEEFPDELITLCCVQFLPNDAYEEICVCQENGYQKTLSLLSADILDDFFLGSLVVKAIDSAVVEKLSQYSVLEPPADYHYKAPTHIDTNGELGRDMHMLEFLERERNLYNGNQSDIPARDLNHFIFGLTIRIEEKACLIKLKEKCDKVLRSLGVNIAEEATAEQPFKRRKL